MSGLLLSVLLAQSAQAASPGPASENPLSRSYMPLRVPLLAQGCAAREEENLGYRLLGFCAGYVTAVLENDPRLADCHPLRGQVMEEIATRQRARPQTDDDVLARDFVVAIARDLCRRTRP